MTAIILAAGTASRLRPFTDTLPKALLPVGGKPLLQRTLEVLDRCCIGETIVVTGHHHLFISRFLESLSLGMTFTEVLNPRFASTQNNYSLWLALRECRNREIILLDADVLFAPEILPLLLGTSHRNALVLKTHSTLSDEEIKVASNPDGRVTAIGKHLDPAASAGESIGIEKFSAESTGILHDILERRKSRQEFYEASFQEMIDQGHPLYAVDSSPYACIEIDTPADIASAEQLVQQHRL